MSFEELITLTSRPPQWPSLVGIVIDDLIILEPRGARRLRAIGERYAEVGLCQNMKKSFEEQTEAKFWGGELDGVAGTIRPSRRGAGGGQHHYGASPVGGLYPRPPGSPGRMLGVDFPVPEAVHIVAGGGMFPGGAWSPFGLSFKLNYGL